MSLFYVVSREAPLLLTRTCVAQCSFNRVRHCMATPSDSRDHQRFPAVSARAWATLVPRVGGCVSEPSLVTVSPRLGDRVPLEFVSEAGLVTVSPWSLARMGRMFGALASELGSGTAVLVLGADASDDGPVLTMAGNVSPEGEQVLRFDGSSDQRPRPRRPRLRKHEKMREQIRLARLRRRKAMETPIKFRIAPERAEVLVPLAAWAHQEMLGLAARPMAQGIVAPMAAFKEYFAGSAHTTAEVAKLGYPVSAPIEAYSLDDHGRRTVYVPGCDLMDRAVLELELSCIARGTVRAAMFATPCKSMSTLMQHLGPGTRRPICPEGSGNDVREVEGNMMAAATALLCVALHRQRRPFLIENPARSWLFRLPCMQQMVAITGAQSITLDQCRFGLAPPDAPHMRIRKRTTLLGVVRDGLQNCSGLTGQMCNKLHSCGCKHLVLLGSVKLGGTIRRRSELAAEYPDRMAKELALALTRGSEENVALSTHHLCP